MLALLKKRPCNSHDITIRHLERKLRRLNKRVESTYAMPSDYNSRDRVATQLAEAKAYLC